MGQIHLVIFSHHRTFWIAVGVGELCYDVDPIVKTLNAGKVINFGEPLFAPLIVDGSWALKSA